VCPKRSRELSRITDFWTAVRALAANGTAWTAVGALAATGTAWIIWWQVSSAGTALYGSNSYVVQKDLIEALDHVAEIQETIAQQGKNEPQKSQLKRSVIKYDSLFEAAAALHNNRGLSDATWEHLLRVTCPNLDKLSYRFEDTILPATKAACETEKAKWQDVPR
jgi:hypothetical protein